MNYVKLVQLADANNDLGHENLDEDLGKLPSVLLQLLVKVTARNMRHNKIDSLSGLEEVLQATQVLVLSLEHDAQLGECT